MHSLDVSSFTRAGRRSRRRSAAGVVIGTLLLAACGGASDSSSSAAEEGESTPTVDSVEGSSADPSTEAAPVAVGAGYVDLVGTDVVPAAEIETNVLPSVVVDDLTNGRKVNFRNLVPQEKPVLLWMWAPH